MSLPKKCIVIDVGNERIKIADVQRNRNDVKVFKSVILETPAGALDDGMILDMEILAEKIRQGLVELHSKTKDIVFVIASSKIITREVSFPDVNNKKLKSIVEMNAAEYFPVNLDEYALDFTVVERVENRGEKSVVVTIVAALASLASQYVFLAKECGMNLAGIDYSGNSLGTFAKKENLLGGNIVVDIGSRGTMVNIVDNGVIKFSRNLLYGSNAIINAIAESFDVEYEEAINISKDRPLLNSSNEENPFLKNDVSDAMNDVLNGISRLVDYYTSRNEIKFDKIILVGGGATIYGLKDYVEGYFSMDAVVLDEFKSVSLSSDPAFIKDSIYFANTIGAIYSDINLLPKKIAQKISDKSGTRIDLLILLLVVVLIAAISFMKVASINSLRMQKEMLKSQLAESQKVIVIKEEWTKLKEQSEFRKDLIDESSSISERYTELIRLMEDYLPQNMFITSINDSGNEIMMVCSTKDKMTAAKFVETMKNLEGFSFESVFVPSIQEVDLVRENLDEANEDENSTLAYDSTYYELTIVLTY